MNRPTISRTMTALAAAILVASTVPAADADTAIASAVANPGRTEADRVRDTTSKPSDVLSFFGVEPGMTVVDLFGGGGYYTELLSYVVGKRGTVYYHTNKAYLEYIGDELKARMAGDHLGNVIQLVTEADALGLPAGKADLVLMVMCYHDLYYVDEGWPEIDRDAFWKQVRAALKPGGTLAVVDHVAASGTGSSAAQTLHRIDKDFAKQDIEAAGFVFVEESDVLRNPADDHSLLVFDPKIRRKTDRFVYKFRKP